MSDQPNILFFITDQHRAEYLGCYGHPIVPTPNIDAIAARGTRFNEFHTASPVCMPNRASLVTGRLPSVNGLRRNGLYLPTSQHTFADVLSDGGYDTAMIGKSHLQPFTGPERQPENPFTTLKIPEAIENGDNWTQEQPMNWAKGEDFQVSTPFYGFKHVDLVTGHGDYCGGNYSTWLRERVGDPAKLVGADNQLPHSYHCPQAVRTAVPEEYYSTSYIRDCAINYLNQDQRKDTPFFAFVSFPDPHHPFNPPGKYWEMYNPDDFEIELPFEALENPSPHLAYIREQYLAGNRLEKGQKAFMADERELREAMALTCGMITMIDDAIGDVLEALASRGLDDNTIVVFNTDHGDYMGDFNMLLKGPAAHRSLTRVPFIWADPTVKNLDQVGQLASTLDIAPTVVERAGLSIYNGIQGQSLLGMMQDDQPLRDHLLIEYEDNYAHWGFDKPAEFRSLIDHRYRITIYKNCEWGELFDLQNDPNELKNLWDEREYAPLRANLTERLLRSMMDASETSPIAARMA